LRESRGDGHVAALITGGLDPCETLVMFGADTGLSADYLQAARGWSEAEWGAARQRLVERGLLTGQAELTTEGAALRRWVEERTDLAAGQPWQELGERRTERLAELLTPIAIRIAQVNQAMEVNPMGLSPSADLARLMSVGAG
jgi:hypothetical protein